MKARTRIAIAGVLVLVALGVPLAFMWVSGHAAANAEAEAIRQAPGKEARAAAERIAERVGRELLELAEREATRPYYEWQSLIVDPRGAYEGDAVVPSPLANGPTEPLVLAHFQIDARGNVTSPAVNEAKGAPAPDPEAVGRLAALRLALSGRRAEPVLVASAGDEGVQSAAAPPQQAAQKDEQQDEDVQAQQPAATSNSRAGKKAVRLASASVVEQRLSNKVYQQNMAAPELFDEILEKKGKPRAFEPGQVTVRVGPFEWEPLHLAGRGVIAASRAVETPNAPKRQGFVVDPDRLATLLEDGEVQGALARPGGGGVVEAPLPLPGLGEVVAVPLPAPREIESLAEVPLTELWVRGGLLTALAVLAAIAILLLVVQAERLLERRQRFAAAAAHELRTPLAGLRMYAEMLAHGLGKPEKQKAYAERLASEAARLGRVVANVLDFTRLERKTLAVRTSRQDLAVAVDEIVRKLEPSLVASGASLVLVRPEGPLMATFDGDALAQIVGNLVDNADKYSREARDRTITVSVADGPDGPEVRVRDHGPGLPASLRRRLFSPFARGAPRDGPAGLGLGLALARALARAQGGEVTAGAPDDGAELVVRLGR